MNNLTEVLADEEIVSTAVWKGSLVVATKRGVYIIGVDGTIESVNFTEAKPNKDKRGG